MNKYAILHIPTNSWYNRSNFKNTLVSKSMLNWANNNSLLLDTRSTTTRPDDYIPYTVDNIIDAECIIDDIITYSGEIIDDSGTLIPVLYEEFEIVEI